jgi:Tfp pilus assembly protein PilO
MWWPLRLKQRRLGNELREAQVQLEQDRKGTVGIEPLEAEVADLERLLNTGRKHVPAESEVAPLLRQISTDLELLGVTSGEVQTQPVIEGVTYSVVPMTLKFTGTYRSLYDFLTRVEQNPRLIRVIRTEMDGSVEQLGAPVAVRLQLMTFYSRSPLASATKVE